MSTTTIRLEEELKARVAAAAERAGKTTHAFILDAISDTVERAEHDNELHALAEARWANIVATGETVPWTGAKAYLEARAAGKRPARPRARKLGR